MRDAYQQATQGESIGFLEEARCGDLAFLTTRKDASPMWAILLSEHEIIHASGKVRVDKIDNMGIVHSETFQRTHRLRVIKKVFARDP